MTADASAKLRVCAAISGRATVLRAVIEASRQRLLPLEFCSFVADRPCPGLEVAAEYGIANECVDFSSFASRESFNEVFEQRILAPQPDLVLLHYNRLVSSRLIHALPGRIINTHYSLLPSFRGFRAIPRAIAAGVHFTGVTIHAVTEEVDGGPVLAQASCPIQPKDTESSLGLRLCATAVCLTLGLLADAPDFGHRRATNLKLSDGEEVVLSLPLANKLRHFAAEFIARQLLQ